MKYCTMTELLVSLLYGNPFCSEKSYLIRGVASIEGDDLVVLYYLHASKIWPDKEGENAKLMRNLSTIVIKMFFFLSFFKPVSV